MAVTKLNNTQIKTIVNAAYKQFTGQNEIASIDLSQFSDTGVTDVAALRERFTGALIAQITYNWYTDTSYRSEYRDVFFEDSVRFGQILQTISATVPEVRENSAWKSFATGDVVGTYVIALPVVDTTYYAETTSYALPITITGQQWDDAFRDEAGLDAFVGYLFMMVDNALVQHMEDLNNLNRNNYILTKQLLRLQEADGIHGVNLVKVWADLKGITTGMTVEEFLTNKDALTNAAETIGLYIGYMNKQTALFNPAGKVRFTPKDRVVVQMLDYFIKRYDSVVGANTFHNELVELPNYEPVPAWQNLNSLDFDNISSIVGKPTGADSAVTINNVVALVCDKWAIMHTTISKRVASQHFQIEDLTHYEYQFRDKYMNNMSMNGVFFFLADVPAVGE